VHPGADELCNNSIDDDCDGGTPDLFDGDGDGSDCDSDCNDDDPSVHPGAEELCNNSVDDDCDGGTTDVFDDDADGSDCDIDCNDNDSSVHPGAEEVCNNSVDDDCDGGTTDIFDDDADGSDCDSDCNDNDSSVHPGADEICNNSVDDDCNGTTVDVFDGDADGAECSIDCNDNDSSVHPGADEVCNNSVDDDCDGGTPDLFDGDGDGVDCASDCDDENDSASVEEDWYIDCDGDGVLGFGTVASCGPAGTCPGPTIDPPTASTTPPTTWDCHDDDPADLYCQDCEDILSAKPSAADGEWMIDGDGSTGAAFAVDCDMAQGGWIVLSYHDGSGANDGNELLFTASATDSNSWFKCDDDAAEAFVDSGITDSTATSDVLYPDTAYTIHYTNPSGTVAYDYDGEISAILGVADSMWVDPSGVATNHMLAVVADDDGDGGHEVYACDFSGAAGTCDDNSGTLLSLGYTGNCGGNSAIPGGESAFWAYHSQPSSQHTWGQGSLELNGHLSNTLVLPGQVFLEVNSGGGAAFGWEYETIRLRGTPTTARSCLDLHGRDPSSPDGIYSIDPDGDGQDPITVECDMTDGGWTVLYIEDFSDGESSGWLNGSSPINVDDSSNCSSNWTNILGGYNELGDGDEAVQTFSTLGVPHTEVRAELDYVVIDSWDDEDAIVQIDGDEVWREEFHFWDASNNRCGPWWDDVGPQEVDEVTAHTSDTVTVRVTSSLNQGPGDESFGVDNVRITIR